MTYLLIITYLCMFFVICHFNKPMEEGVSFGGTTTFLSFDGRKTFPSFGARVVSQSIAVSFDGILRRSPSMRRRRRKLR